MLSLSPVCVNICHFTYKSLVVRENVETWLPSLLELHILHRYQVHFVSHWRLKRLLNQWQRNVYRHLLIILARTKTKPYWWGFLQSLVSANISCLMAIWLDCVQLSSNHKMCSVIWAPLWSKAQPATKEAPLTVWSVFRKMENAESLTFTLMEHKQRTMHGTHLS